MKVLSPVVVNEDVISRTEVLTTPRYVDHGATASTPRPAGTRPVIWRGTVEPTNMINGDVWEEETGALVVSKADVGLGNVDNTSDASKPVSTAQQAAINAKTSTVRLPHTWHVPGEVKVASGDTDYILPFSINFLPATVRVVHVEYGLNSGSSATVMLRRRNTGNGITDIFNSAIGPGISGAAITPFTLNNSDRLEIVVTAVSGTPRNLWYTVTLDFTF